MILRFIRKFVKGFFIFLTVPIALLFLLACVASFINPGKFWPGSFLSLTIPYLAILLVFAFIFWLAMKPRLSLIPLISLLIGWQQLDAAFAFRFKTIFTKDLEKKEGLRIVSWNVGSMYGTTSNTRTRLRDREEIAQTIVDLNPDIICLQEFNHSETQGEQANNIGLFTEKYPYYFFSKDLDKRNGFYQAGSIIFSKYPLVDSGKITYPAGISESFIYTDIVYNLDTLRVYNIHLQSYKFSREDYEGINKIQNRSDSALDASVGIIKKMKRAFQKRGTQADIIRASVDSTKLPNIICGDFNDVPGSYTYFTIRGKHQDAFLRKSWGVGRTYYSIAPTLRIDYILPDDNFIINQFDMVDEDLSDHLLLVCDVNLVK